MPAPAAVLFPTCVVEALAPRVATSARRVLERLGFDVTVAPGTTCCGQPAWNAGFAADAARVAATTCDALSASGAATICVPSGSCATMMRVYWPELFGLVGDAPRSKAAVLLGERVREFSEVVADHEVGGRFEAVIAYHRSCHMTRELGIVGRPTGLVDALDGAQRVPWMDDVCCGFGGTFSVKQPEISVAMADDKIDSLVASGADTLVGCDQSCLTHLEGRMRRRGVPVEVRHLAEVLDEAMEAG
jgi:L-lactate dehydrogenase complex protein LldE